MSTDPSGQSSTNGDPSSRWLRVGVCMALGLGIGLALGSALRNPGSGIAIGIGIGITFSIAFGGKGDESSTPGSSD